MDWWAERNAPVAEQRLERLSHQKVSVQVIDTLGQFLEYASDQEVARIRPRAFAQRCVHQSNEP